MPETNSAGSEPSAAVALMSKRLSHHQGTIRRFIARRSGPHVLRETTVDDLYQDTVVVAVSKAEEFVHGDEASFATWCFGIARNLISSTVRRQKRSAGNRRIREAGSTGPGVSESKLGFAGRTPSSLAALGEYSVALRSAIDELPEHYQEALIGNRIEERPMKEVAEGLGRSRAATCRIVHRAIDAIELEE